MSRRLKQAAVVVIATFALAQLIRPEHANPPVEVSRRLQAHVGTSSGLVSVLDRACGDCHSNQTVWTWYTQIAPLSWAMVYEVNQGRKAVNFSEWGTYPAERQRHLLVASCQDVSTGKMPGPYPLIRPETRLSAQDIKTICAATRQAEAESSRDESRGR